MRLSSRANSFERFRDIDVFIEKLEATIQFFTGLEASNNEGSDGFVPFV